MAQEATAIKAPGAARVRVQEILLGVAATAVLAGILTFWAWLAISMVQVREDIVQLRSEVAQIRGAVERNTKSIERNTATLQRIEALLQAERSNGKTAPRQ